MECNDWKLICCYTRKRAIDDGIMVDVSDFVSDFGFIVPVAITNNLFTRIFSQRINCLMLDNLQNQE